MPRSTRTIASVSVSFFTSEYLAWVEARAEVLVRPVGARLKERLDELGLPILVQGQGAPARVLLE